MGLWNSVEEKLPLENELVYFKDDKENIYLGCYDDNQWWRISNTRQLINIDEKITEWTFAKSLPEFWWRKK